MFGIDVVGGPCLRVRQQSQLFVSGLNFFLSDLIVDLDFVSLNCLRTSHDVVGQVWIRSRH